MREIGASLSSKHQLAPSPPGPTPRPKPQPVVAVLATRRITKIEIARQLGYTPQWVARQLNGYTRTTEPFRRGVAEILDLPETILFRDGGSS